MSKNKFALGALIGTAVGVIVGFLTAPKSGKETRADIKNKAGEIKDDVSKKAEEIGKDASKIASDVKEKAKDVADDVIEGAIDLKNRTERAAEGAKKGFFNKK